MRIFGGPSSAQEPRARRTLADFESIRPESPARHTPEKSSLELHRLREAAGNELSATIYFFDDRLVIAAPVVGVDGEMHAELIEPVVKPEPIDDEHLGELAMNALLAFIAEKPPSLRDRRKSDWPAFRASGARSVSEFERKAVEIGIRTHLTSLELSAAPVSSLEHHRRLVAHCTPGIFHIDLGAEMRNLVRGVQVLRECGVV